MKMARAMRIVALNNSKVWVQGNVDGEWKQVIISRKAFETMMQISFPQYVEEYATSHTDKDMADFFYHYGETEKMIHTGEAYIFTPYKAE